MNTQLNIDEQILEQINLLYVSERKKYLKMYRDEWGNVKYSTIHSNEDDVDEEGNPKAVLIDPIVKRHIKRGMTIGVFAGEYLSKFICFDVDTDDISKAKGITYRLVDVLMRDFNIPERYIHVSLSGGKGFHVEMFFSEVITNKDIELFYDVVLLKLGDLDDNSKVELRPTASQGVKIPLSRHLGTNKICYYVDTITLEPIRKKEHILTIEQLDKHDFRSLIFGEDVFSLTLEQGEKFEQVASSVKMNIKSLEDFVSELDYMLQQNKLIRNGTRNNVTLFLSMYLYSSGHELEDVREKVKAVLHNTWLTARELISANTSYEFMMDEVDRISELVFRKQYVLGKGKKEITISKGEILKILELKPLHLKKLMFSMMIHYKKHKKKDKTFYMAYSVMTKMGNTANRQRLLNHLIELEQLGYVEIVSRNKFNIPLSRQKGKIYLDTNVYKMAMQEGFEDESLNASITFDVYEKVDIFEIASKLISKNEAKKILTSDVYKKQMSKHFKKKHII